MTDKKKLLVIALGGNALLDSKSKGTIEEREAAAADTAEQLIPLFNSTVYDVILTHGNGPQVGNLLIQQEEGSSKVPPMPLDVCVAETQGEIGYILQKAIQNAFEKHNIKKSTIAMLTQVLVDEKDPAFEKPSKPVGPYYSADQTREILKIKNWKFKEDPAGKGFRRVVASPKPIKVIQTQIISDLTKDGYIVISVGGGGIPVYHDKNNDIAGVEAVIDKDLASAQLAIDLKADKFVILTNVEQCYINFRQPNEIKLTDLNLDEATTYYDQGHFTAGSMGPKVQSVIEFVSATGNHAIITHITKLVDSLEGKAGTLIHL
ncbi:MAG: carbamate kinase [Ignavibacteria bacterium]|nr:carbamate kinase [Ignavibacteria bacterium]